MIALPKKIYDRMIAHAKEGFPNEACGILAGPKADTVSDFYPMKNVDYSAISYFMDPKEPKKLRRMMPFLDPVETPAPAAKS